MINTNFTTTKIDFLNDIDKSIQIDNKSEKYFYLKITNWDLYIINLFIEGIPDNHIFTVFPFITTSGYLKDPYLRLSDHFLVTNQSNAELISEFLNKQWNNTDFNTDKGVTFFKLKRIYVSYKPL